MASILDLHEAHQSPITSLMKGVPAGTRQLALEAIGSRRWNVLRQDLPFPVAVLKESALRHNGTWMRSFAEKAGVRLCPHGKTTMSPQIFERQLQDGAWGMTAATAGHVQIYRRFGVRRILLANQLVGKENIRIVLDELAANPDFDFYCLVDSRAGIELLRDAVKAHGKVRHIQVLLEVGIMGGRTGARTLAEALALADVLASCRDQIRLRGVECFEGIVSINAQQDPLGCIGNLLELTVDVTRELVRRRAFADGDVILSGGGSAYFDIVSACIARTGAGNITAVLRSGCYISHDSLMYMRHASEMRARDRTLDQLGPGLRPALEVWGVVQSLPEPGLAIVTFGKRDVSYDIEMPVAEVTYRAGREAEPQPLSREFRFRALNDQHAYLEVPRAHTLAVGDLIGAGISHPCTTFDKWQLLYLVDDDYTVLGGIRTYF